MFEGFSASFLAYEPALRLAALFATLGVLASCEVFAPRRGLTQSRRQRWIANLGLALVDTALLRLAAPAAAVGLAVAAQNQDWGLLNLLDAPGWATIILSLVLLDLALYAQHMATHAMPILWRLHRVHHSDLDIDLTTGLRFHPVEILLSMAYKSAVVVALGADPAAVLLYEVLLSSSSLFTHSNIRIPKGIDRALRWIWVTPDMHRVHHSILRSETDSNYASCLSLWDRLFRTYQAQPQAGHDAMTIGITSFRAPIDQRLWRLLLQPLQTEQAIDTSEAGKP